MKKRITQLNTCIADCEAITVGYHSINPAVPLPGSNGISKSHPYEAFNRLEKYTWEKQKNEEFIDKIDMMITNIPSEHQAHLYSIFFIGRSYEKEAERYQCSVHKLITEIDSSLEKYLDEKEVKELVDLYNNLEPRRIALRFSYLA